MDFGYLSFLSEAWFVVPWYVFGFAAAVWVIFDLRHYNRQVKPAVAWAWPIIVFFFSIIGLLLYHYTTRPPGIQKLTGKKAERAYQDYVNKPFRKVTGSVIHCVGGDGLGIITAMVIARILGMSFWQEFWFEYIVGFLFGWFIFQFKAMLNMTDSKRMALWMGGRAEFFSMMTVMAGMGLVMGFVTPSVVGEQPLPETYAFWGFAMLGLFVGYWLTYPMNWLLVKMKWKHGLG